MDKEMAEHRRWSNRKVMMDACQNDGDVVRICDDDDGTDDDGSKSMITTNWHNAIIVHV